MAVEPSIPPLSFDDYAAIDDGRRYQVVEGLLVMSPAPSVRHQAILYSLALALAPARRHGTLLFAPCDVVLRAKRPAIVFQPDMLFVSRERAAIVTAANVQGAPDLVIEVLSPSNARLDAITKRRIYAAYGVREYWIVAPEADQIEVFTLGAGTVYGKPTLYEPGDRMSTPLLPGFELAIADVFETDELGPTLPGSYTAPDLTARPADA